MEQDKTTPTHLAISVTDWNAAWEQIGDIVGITPNGHRAAMRVLGQRMRSFTPTIVQDAPQATAEGKE